MAQPRCWYLCVAARLSEQPDGLKLDNLDTVARTTGELAALSAVAALAYSGRSFCRFAGLPVN